VLGFVSVIRLRVVVNQTRNRRRLFRLSTQTEKKKTSPGYFLFVNFVCIARGEIPEIHADSTTAAGASHFSVVFFFLEKKWGE
jgi:hypothetical protein